MTDLPRQPLHPSGRLARLLDDARQARAAAHRREATLLMINAARCVRDLFPQAATLLVDARDSDSVDVIGVLDHDGRLAWTRGDEDQVVQQYRTSDNASRSDVLDIIELDLHESLGGQDPIELWAGNDTNRAVLHVDLPTVDRVATALFGPTPPRRVALARIREWNREARFLPGHRYPALPAVAVAGAHVYVYVDRHRARPTLRISVRLDEIDPAPVTLPGEGIPIEITVQDTTVYLDPPEE